MSETSRAAYERRWERFMRWNGDDPKPTFTHWTSKGSFKIEGSIPRPCITKVYFDDRLLGCDSRPEEACRNLARGNYDRDLGFSAVGFGMPPYLEDWNNLR